MSGNHVVYIEHVCITPLFLSLSLFFFVGLNSKMEHPPSNPLLHPSLFNCQHCSYTHTHMHTQVLVSCGGLFQWSAAKQNQHN